MNHLPTEYDFENAPCGYLGFLPDGTITTANQTLLRWLGYRKEEVVGKTKLDGITAKGTRLYLQMFVYPMLQMQGYINELRLEVVGADGRVVSCLFNASAVKESNGIMGPVHAILFSISERKRYEDEILAAKKTAEAVAEHKDRILQVQRRIVSILGHDTRAPLFSVTRKLKLAMEGEMSAEEVFPYFELMTDQLDATLILLNDILAWSKAVLSNEERRTEAYPLQAVVDDVFGLLAANAAAKNLWLRSEVHPALSLSANRAMVTFIIRNLVNNAIKFTRTGGVLVSASATEGSVRITVTDSGVGMPPAQLDRYRTGGLPSTEGTDNEKGSGMGLVLVHEFLLQLKGSLWAESTPEVGTIVTVSLPLSAEAAPLSHPTNEPLAKPAAAV